MTDVPSPALLTPLALRGVELRNRVVISPMQEYAAGADGKALEFHLVHLGRFALGGAGPVFTEELAVSPEARLTCSDLGIWDDGHVSPLSNRRDDEYGGDRAGRMRLALEIAEAVRSEWTSGCPIFYRLSCVGDLPEWWELEDTLVLASELGRRGIDVIDCSSRGLARRGTPVTTPRS